METLKVKMKKEHRWVHRLRNRPVKHTRVYITVHVFLPVVYGFACVWTFHTLFMDMAERQHWPVWAWLLTIPLQAANFSMLGKVARLHIDAVMERVNHVEIEPIDLRDRGEALEEGPGWRHMTGTVATHEGKGRLERTNLETLDLLVNPETQETRVVSSTYPGVRIDP